MKRRMLFTSAVAAMGAGLIAVSALAQPTTPPTPPAAAAAKKPAMSAEDHAAMMDARIAAVHAGLKLTPEQEKLWPPVEAAARDMAKLMHDGHATRGAGTASTDPLERMTRMGETMSQHGTAMVKVATAARPLYATLSEDQKRRLRMLMRQNRMERGERHGHHGEGDMMSHHREHHGWNQQR